jgi:hypothetical protein
MNAETKEQQTALTLPERASVALGSPAHEVKLRELVLASAAIMSVTNKAGREECHAAYMTLKNTRVNINHTVEEVTEAINAARAAGRAEAVAIIMGMDPEDPLSECIVWGENGDCGDHSAYWCTDKLQAVFKTDDLLMNMMDKAETDAMEAHFMLEDAKRAATPAQPIADVSAPTDERTAFEASRTRGHHYDTDEFGSYSNALVEGDFRTWQAARAAAPVSTDTGCHAINPPEFPKYMPDFFEHQSKEAVWDHACLTGWRSAAPVSGQAASIDVSEGVEILDSLIGNIEQGGNYSVEATLTFLGQIKQCLTVSGQAAQPQPAIQTPGEDAQRKQFESLASDSYGFKRSRRGTYVNASTARDWKWFQLGVAHASNLSGLIHLPCYSPSPKYQNGEFLHVEMEPCKNGDWVSYVELHAALVVPAIQAQPLTDAEIFQIADKIGLTYNTGRGIKLFAREVERHLTGATPARGEG